MSTMQMAVKTSDARDKLIVALDVDSLSAANKLVDSLRDAVRMFKVGSQLFTLGGPTIVTEILRSGARVFLDLKFHDIPHQVAGSAQAATRLGVSMFTIHASGGMEMMRRAVAAATETSDREGLSRPAVVAVSVLTSMDAASLNQIGISSTPIEAVVRLAKLAQASRVDGAVASPQEAYAIRSSVLDQDFLIVTPGIRPSELYSEDSRRLDDDQRRVATPAAALTAGADYLVVGRPITKARNPEEAARKIITEIENVARNE